MYNQKLSLFKICIFFNRRISGFFDFRIPQYIVRDPEAIKRIAINDFDHFEDHRNLIDESVDKVFGNMLFMMKGERWRQMRATLSPAFTGSKMRQMFGLVTECADNMTNHFIAQAKNGQTINIETRDIFTKYTNDVIATCAFGLKVDSIADPDNEFYQNGKMLTTPAKFWTAAVIFVIAKLPMIARVLNFANSPPVVAFRKTIMETMLYRKVNNIHRPDMVNMMMQIREGTLKQQKEEKEEAKGFATVDESEVATVALKRAWNDDEILAQFLIFYSAAFDMTANLLTLATYELTINPDIQQKLYEEIVAVERQLDGKRIDYDVLQRMKYLDQVISETLRKWPPAVQLDRLCVKDYEYNDGDKYNFKIEKGTGLIFPTYGIHNDPKFYANPAKFDPERFNDENKGNIQPGTYLPFGIGPRNCIGSRFALMEAKAILYYMLLNFSIEPNENTQIPLKFNKSFLSMHTEKGLHLELKPRKTLFN